MLKLVLAALLASGSVFATELDPVSPAQEIIVREDAQGNREVFKVSSKLGVEDAASAEAAIKSFVTTSNKVNNVVPASELDRVTSTEAWYYWGWNYACNWYGYSYYYRPYYNWSWGHYNYYWYRWW